MPDRPHSRSASPHAAPQLSLPPHGAPRSTDRPFTSNDKSPLDEDEFERFSARRLPPAAVLLDFESNLTYPFIFILFLLLVFLVFLVLLVFHSPPPPRLSSVNEELFYEKDWRTRSRIRSSPALTVQTKVAVLASGSFGMAMATVLPPLRPRSLPAVTSLASSSSPPQKWQPLPP